jgi:hypothetical protein
MTAISFSRQAEDALVGGISRDPVECRKELMAPSATPMTHENRRCLRRVEADHNGDGRLASGQPFGRFAAHRRNGGGVNCRLLADTSRAGV